MLILFDALKSLFATIEFFLGSYPFLLVIILLAFAFKGVILANLILRRSDRPVKTKLPWFFVMIMLVSAMFSNFAWIVKLIECLFLPNLDYRFVLFPIRIAWGFSVVQYQALALFIESLVEEQYKISLHQKILLPISTCFFIFFIGLAFFDFNCLTSEDKSLLEHAIQKYIIFYSLFPLILSSLFITIYKLRKIKIPRILRKQLKILIQVIIGPIWVSDFLQFYPFNFLPNYISSSYAVVGISTMVLTYAIYHCMRKVMGLRFLNLQPQVQSPNSFNFIDDFKTVLEQLSHVTSAKELSSITQNFFKDAFHIPLNRTHLYIRAMDASSPEAQLELPKEATIIESFICAHAQNCSINDLLLQNKVLIADEIDFSNFYEEQEAYKKLLPFLEKINADIFIPIHEKNMVIAYIVVERYARVGTVPGDNDFYTRLEQDQMEVFASYLGNIINLLQNKNISALIEKEKEMREELYHKHQEINQYKESIRSFLHPTLDKKIGIVFYKNRTFTFGNQTAKEMVEINLNTHQGHPTAQALKQLANQVLEYRAPQTMFTTDHQDKKLVISGILNLEQNNVIITMHHPEISDIVKRKIDLLKDPSKWDYLLYLETTKSGKLVDQLIPGSGEILLDFKTTLLKLALSKKALLLTIPEDDLLPTVEVLHHISLRENLHVLNLSTPVKNFDIAVKLFGINPILGLNCAPIIPLLEKLNHTGTLFIQNIHFLDLETQDYVAEFLKYGVYRIFKGDQKATSTARIICSTTMNIQALVQEGKFSQALFNELKVTSLAMPSLLSLPEQEFNELTDNLTKQAIKTTTFKNMLELTDKEKKRLLETRPTSIQELKIKIQQLLITKSKKNQIYQETEFDPAYDISDPELAEAARLGKYALKDPRVMGLLWTKFSANQNKIATFLGVNRSSVNRRCKDYKLI